jgi:uncharacterized protein DUF5069
MGPLDLTQRPPRPCRAELQGIMFLPRSIDKARASLPGGVLGSYFVTRAHMRTLSGLFFRRLGVALEEFADAVATAPDDAAVASWLLGKVEQERIDGWNALLAGIRMRDIDAATLANIKDYYGEGPGWSPDDALIDVIDGDDRRAFPAVRTSA